MTEKNKHASKYRPRPRNAIVRFLTVQSFSFMSRATPEECVERLEKKFNRAPDLVDKVESAFRVNPITRMSLTIDDIGDGDYSFSIRYRARRRDSTPNLMIFGYLEQTDSGKALVAGEVIVDPGHIPLMILILPFFQGLAARAEMVNMITSTLRY